MKTKNLNTEDYKEITEYLHEEKTDKNHDILKQKINIKCKTKGQKELVNSIRMNEITICAGLAGTGKTYLACAQALKLIKMYQKYQKIVIVKSVTTLKDEEIGFLKGTMEDKMEPFIYSFINNFEKVIGKEPIRKLRESGEIEVLPIAYMRGINLDNSIVIIDESQNISISNIRTILTRLGKNSKMIFLGDTKQIDRKKKSDSSLEFMIKNFSDIPSFGLVELNESDIVRNPIIKIIEERFDKLEDENKF